MSVTIAAVKAGLNAKSWNITASADGDTAAQITHGFTVNYAGVAPALVWMVSLQTQGRLKDWVLGVVDTNFINLSGVSTTGSGLAGTPQVQVIALLPNSIMD